MRSPSLKTDKKGKTMFYTFSQNNSGGSFVFDTNAGIGTYVIIEADDEREAIYRATGLGIYFDGVEMGSDCECCGDRWYEPYGGGTEEPSIYSGMSIEEYQTGKWYMKWSDNEHEIFVHYKDGRIEGH
jgi:hypothetical protein